VDDGVVDEILRSLPAGTRVLDLGSGAGSFPASMTTATVIRLDREVRTRGPAVTGDAARLPFASGAFQAVIANHTFEHFDDLDAVLREVRRVIEPDGALFVSVPDASTLCDRIYRWLADGGGHVNPFTSGAELARRIENTTGLKHVATRTLYSSLSYLNRRNEPGPAPRRLWLLGGGTETSLYWLAWASRTADRTAGTRFSVYGWAMYFGSLANPVNTTGWPNVCLRCGSGAPSSWLKQECLLPRRSWRPESYRCPICGAVNPFAGADL
jgi:SAM-dependent methyltransferase